MRKPTERQIAARLHHFRNANESARFAQGLADAIAMRSGERNAKADRMAKAANDAATKACMAYEGTDGFAGKTPVATRIWGFSRTAAENAAALSQLFRATESR